MHLDFCREIRLAKAATGGENILGFVAVINAS